VVCITKLAASNMPFDSKIIVYTAIFGGRDTLREPPREWPGVSFICFTDTLSLRSKIWHVVYVPSSGESPRKQAKRYKILPHHYFPDAVYSVWVDGTHVPQNDPRAMLTEFLRQDDIAVFRHHSRNDVYEEARECIRQNLDSSEILERQVARYRAAGYPEHAGLAACTVIFRRHTVAVARAMEAWWQEIEAYSIRDQISFNYILWVQKLPCFIIEENVYRTGLFSYVPHGGWPFFDGLRLWLNKGIAWVGALVKKISPALYFKIKRFLSL